ncbi:MAG: family 2 glycosyl transferase [Eubacterium sp.]
MKKVLVPVAITLVVLLILAQLGALQKFGINKASISANSEIEEFANTSQNSEAATDGTVKYRVKAEGDYFYIYKNGTWNQVFWKGVNLGSGKPGAFPGELSISYDEYYKWFTQISEMNANCIRVYTAMMPDFYNALYDFNSQAEDPIYFFQGVWIDENDIAALNDVYAENSKILNQFKKDALDLVDIIHGAGNLPSRAGYASGAYSSDLSPWFAGWILGMEFDPGFIKNVNTVNPEKNSYDGSYLYAQGSTPFETFLAEIGDSVIQYESEKYKWQVPVAFCNWITTDPLTHPEEPIVFEDSVTLNTESIKSRTSFCSNLFASYHIYPYYPDTMNYQKDYISYKDSSGKINPYEAYLKDLKLAHTMPIMVSEFGVSTSRGMAHKGIMNYNQGNMEETKAGDAIVDMLNSIYTQKYAGGLVFNWQDEWFKRTWNNESFDIYERRAYWPNKQTCEQNFGILSFEPGEETTCLIDGNVSDWNAENVIVKNDYGTLSVKSDEGYVYFMIDTNDGFDFDNDTILIPLDTISNQGSNKMNSKKVSFSEYADFVIQINGKDNSRILCDAYYDVFYYLYGEQYKVVPLNNKYEKKNSGIFNTMKMCLGYEMEIPSTKQKIPFESYETGKLEFGISDPESKDYYSLSDFYEKDGIIEIRIPWQLLNFTDPSSGKIMDDFYTQQSITSTTFNGFKIGYGILSKNNKSQPIEVNGEYDYDKWGTNPTYHERLKKSYYILQKGFSELGG